MEHIQEDKQLCTLYRVRVVNPILGVPITFLDKYNPDQFNILGRQNAPVVNGKSVYKRIFIHRQ